jgi:hypothetical protein
MSDGDVALALGVLVGAAGLYLEEKPPTHPLFGSAEEANRVLAIVQETAPGKADRDFLMRKLNQAKGLMAKGEI